MWKFDISRLRLIELSMKEKNCCCLPSYLQGSLEQLPRKAQVFLILFTFYWVLKKTESDLKAFLIFCLSADSNFYFLLIMFLALECSGTKLLESLSNLSASETELFCGFCFLQRNSLGLNVFRKFFTFAYLFVLKICKKTSFYAHLLSKDTI